MAPPTAATDYVHPAPAPADQREQDTKKTGFVQKNYKGFVVPRPPKFEDKLEEREYRKQRLAAAFRVFGRLGFDEGVAGHLTYRDPVLHDHFWVNPFGLAFSLMTASDLLLVAPDGSVVMGGKPGNQVYNQAAYAIHHAIHTARPDVDAACHSHSIHGKAFSAFGRELDISTQDSCAFYKDHAVYPNFGGVVLAEEESARIAEYLGDKKALIMQNHGILTVGHTIESATAWFIGLEKACQVQLLIDAAANGKGVEPIKIGEEEAEFTYKQVGTERVGYFQSSPYFQMVDAETQGAYKA